VALNVALPTDTPSRFTYAALSPELRTRVLSATLITDELELKLTVTGLARLPLRLINAYVAPLDSILLDSSNGVINNKGSCGAIVLITKLTDDSA
jgi:hypothetical protein